MKTSLSIAILLLALAQGCGAKDLVSFDAQSMISGYCYAGSRKDDKALGGYGPSDNAPKKNTDKTPGTKGQVELVALPADPVPFKDKFLGFRLLLINRGSEEVPFAASDSRLNIICEARDETGSWKPIEELPSSFCGNSYHSAYLPGGHHWEFSAPVYSGPLKTKLRFMLKGKQPIYSNEFDGSINPVQFKQTQTR